MGKKTLLAFVAGASAGAILGILFAPDKGSNTRRKVSSSANDIADSIQTTFGDIVDNLKNALSGARDEIGDLADEAKEKVKAETEKFSSPAYGEGN